MFHPSFQRFPHSIRTCKLGRGATSTKSGTAGKAPTLGPRHPFRSGALNSSTFFSTRTSRWTLGLAAIISLWTVTGCFESEATESLGPVTQPIVQSVEPTKDVAQDDHPVHERHTTISSDDQSKLEASVGKSVIIKGRIVSARASKAGHEFLNFENRGFYLFCPKDALAEFGERTPAKRFDKQLIEVAGKVERFSGKLQIRVTSPDQIRLADSPDPQEASGVSDPAAESSTFELRSIGRDAWLSPAGLEYRGRDPDGLTRLEHIERHCRDQPERDGPHGVFDAKGNEAFALIDEAWMKIQNDNIQPRNQGQRDAYEVPMGRRVGYLGGQVGKSRGNPPLRQILIVVNRGTNRIITAYPK